MLVLLQLVVAVPLLGGCGQKGPLYLPGDAPKKADAQRGGGATLR